MRIQNNDNILPTWIRKTQFSRLDYYLCSNHLLNNNVSTNILPPLLSDHRPIMFTMKINEKEDKGKGTWKFNNSLIYEEKF